MAEVAEPVGVKTNSQFPVMAGLEDVPQPLRKVTRTSNSNVFSNCAFITAIVVTIRSPS